MMTPILRRKEQEDTGNIPKLVETNPLPVKVSELGKCVEEKDWEHLEIRKDCLDKPLVIEAISRRVFPAQGYRKGSSP